MFLLLLAFLMKVVENRKYLTQSPRSRGVDDNNSGSNKMAWQHIALRGNKFAEHSNSSSTSSGCDSNGSSSSSKENHCGDEQQHASLTPQQLQQIRYYQRLQQEQLQLLQQQLLQRRRLQEQLRAEGVWSGGQGKPTSLLACNEQYRLQQRQQQQQQQQQKQKQQQLPSNNNNNFSQNAYHNLFSLNNYKNCDNNYENKSCTHDNNSNSNNIVNNKYDVANFLRGGLAKGQTTRRGMTEFSTNNDISRQTHQTQPLHTSPHQPLNRHHYQQPSPLQHQHNNSPQHNLTHHGIHHQLPNLNNHLTFKQTQNHKNNQQTLTLNSSANINPRSPITSPTSVTHSSAVPYKKPLNSPNNSPFAYAYYGAQQLQHQQHLPIASTAATTQHQQQLRLLHSKLSQTNYQQHLNDLLLQQQQLHQQQQQVLNAAGGAKKDEAGVHDELSDECLKQNVAIVLNNLDRYNNALRSVILNEQVNNSLFDDSVLDLSSISSNNNFLLSGSSKMATPATPESDYNSNATTPGSRVGSNMLPTQQHLQQLQQQQNQQHDNVVGFATSAACGFGAGGNLRSGGGGWDGVGGGINGAGSNLNCSLASSHDFSTDNSDYQWFLDYGYRDGCGMQRSVLSSLSASYNGIGELYYDDLAKNIDANLAEVDIESFRAEDIHSLLSRLPSYCKTLGGGGSIGLGANCRLQQHGSQISSSSTNELIDNSICKSELLFSPVKESHISVDSLDLDAYPDEGDIILTCKANKDNYTIAFEGSIIYSDESCYAEPNEVSLKNKQNCINLHSNLDDIVKRKSLDVSMSRSDHQMTTWSKLKKGNVLQRYPSGNNNTADHGAPTLHAPCTVRKSSSLPNLQSKTDAPSCNRQQLNVSHVSTSTLDSCRLRNLLPMCQMPISCSSTTASTSDRVMQRCLRQPSQQLQHNQPQQQQRQHHHHHHRQQEQQQQHHYHHQHAQLQTHDSSSSAASASSATQQKHQSGNGNTTCGTSATSSNQPALNLVKLFIKQKSSSSSTDGENHASAHTCMDVSSGCWPSSDAAGSGGSSSSFEQRLRKKSMNDSGKGSALSRHDEEDTLCCAGGCREDAVGVGQSYVVDAGGGGADNEREKHDVFYEEDRTLTSSPAAQRRLSVPPRHPQVRQLAQRHQKNSNNNGSSESSLQLSDASHSNSEPLTQVFMSSAANKDSRSTDRENESIMHKENNVSQCHDSTSSEMITRSMQTSCGTLSTRSSLSERFRFVPPSFLSKLNNLGEEKQAPIYVIYPNYALPDLGFVKTTNTPDVIFSPFNFKTPLEGGVNAASAKDRFSEDEILKNIDYKHIIDWKSLVTLLPTEYRKRLQHIPEVSSLNLEQGGDAPPQKPLFCMSPPIRRPQRSAHLCDCAHFFQQAAQTQREGSSSSGSSQQPSSGYRGSSTILTDSELGDTPAVATSDPLKQMYVYQYEQHQRTDSGVDSPSAHSPASKPTPQPRGILRKTNPPRGGARNKRNSMFEEQHAKLTKQEKRRSLQEPAYNHYLAGGSGSMDELYDALPEEEVFEENLVQAYFAGMTQANQRLSRKDLDARARAENFLSSLPRSELKYYAEIAAILESSEEQQQAAAVQYDAAALKKEVSRVLSQQKKVSFNENEQLLHPQPPHQQQQTQQQLLPTDARHKRFSTPPNSPNISMASGLRMPPNSAPRRCSQLDAYSSKRKPAATIDAREQMKLTSNRFKRLQIQWELLSNDSSMMLKDLASEQETKSGSSTPTQTAGGSAGHRSRIPRPVSYPAGRRVSEPLKPPKVSVKPVPNKGFAKIVKPVVSPRIARVTQHGQQDASKAATATRSPSRIVQPKRYSISSPTAATATSPGTSRVTTPTSGMPSVVSRARTPTSRPATAATAPNTPKRRVQSPRTIPRVR